MSSSAVARLAAFAAALLLSSVVYAQTTYAGFSDNTIAQIPTPTSSGQAFCAANPNVIFAVRSTVTGPTSVNENAGTIQVNFSYLLVAYCGPPGSATELSFDADAAGSATPNVDYTPGSATRPSFGPLTQFASGQTTATTLPITIIDDSSPEPTETIIIDDVARATLTSSSTTTFTSAPSPDFTINILDNDSGPTGADLAISQSNNAPTPLVVGSTFQKTLSVTNNGPSAASNIIVGDNLAPQLMFVSSTCGANANGQFISYSIATLANGATSACALTLRVIATGSISNTASITSSQPTDPNTTNNSTTATIGTATANQPPVVTSCTATSMNGQPVTFDLLPCASDPEGGPLTFTPGAQPLPSQGSFTVDGHFATFTPASGFQGTVQLPIQVRDDANNVTNLVAQVTVTGNAVNQPPITTNGTAATMGVQPVTVNLATLVTDPENDALTFAVAVPPPAAQGTATLSGSSLTFTPTRGFQGNAVIGLTARDALNPAMPFTVTVTVTNNPLNRPPVAVTPSAAAPPSNGGAEVSIMLVPLFNDPDGDALTFAIATPPANGTARVVGSTAFYSPTANFEGSDQFVVRATDPSGLTTTVIITVGVSGNLDPAETADDLNDALDTIGGGSEVARGAVAAVATACGAAGANSGALATCNALVDAADASNGAAVEDALENLAAEEISAQSNVATAIMSQQRANVAARMAAVRGGASGLSLAGLSMFAGNGALSLGMFGQDFNAAQDESAAGGNGDLRPSPWGVFVNGSIGGGNRDGGGTEAGFDFDNYGLTGGVDYRLNDQAFVGLALGYSAAEVDLDNASGELDTDGLGLTAYYSWYGTNGWYADGSLGYFRNDYEQLRVIDLTAIGLTIDRALSETDASQFVATLGIGYEFSRNGWLLTPEFRIEYAGTDIDGFEETGSNDSGFLLSFPDQSFQSLQYSGALQVARAISISSGVVQPFLRLDWYYESDNDGFTIIPRLRSDPTQPFAAIVIDDPDRNYGSISGGLSWVRPGGTQMYVSLFRTFAYDDLEQWVLRGGLRWEF